MGEPRNSWLVLVPEQGEAQPGGPRAIVDRLSEDHRVLDELVEARDAEPDVDVRRRDVHGSTAWNRVVHLGQGAAVGVLRALLAQAGVRGVAAWSVLTGVRLAVDQPLENGAGVGAPPSTWSRPELVVDVTPEAVHVLVTGPVADRALPRR